MQTNIVQKEKKNIFNKVFETDITNVFIKKKVACYFVTKYKKCQCEKQLNQLYLLFTQAWFNVECHLSELFIGQESRSRGVSLCKECPHVLFIWAKLGCELHHHRVNVGMDKLKKSKEQKNIIRLIFEMMSAIYSQVTIIQIKITQFIQFKSFVFCLFFFWQNLNISVNLAHFNGIFMY